MNVYIGGTKDYSAMRGPCDEGFHIPTVDNWNNLKAIYNAIVPSGNRDLTQHLKFVSAKGITNTSSSASISYPTKITIGIRSGTFRCWLCEQSSIKNARTGWSSMSSLQDTGSSNKSSLLEIRPFKDTGVIPDNTWTALYQGEGNAGIYHNSSLGLISLSSDGYTWLTISDKNLGATSIGDNGNMYQWGNNYGFTFSSGEYSSGFGTDFVDAGSYGPLNYYSNSLPVFRSDSNGDVFYYWDSSNNSNLRGGVTGPLKMTELKNAYIGEVYEYSYDFRNKTLSSVTSDGWTVSEGSFDSSFGSNGLHGGTSWNVLTKTTNKTLSSTSIINIETNVNITSTTYGQTNVGLIMGGTNEIFLSIYYNGSQDWYRLSIDGTNYGQYVSHSAGDKKIICKIDLGNKTYNATIGSTNITGSLSNTQVNNLINKTVSIKCVAKDEYVGDVSITIE